MMAAPSSPPHAPRPIETGASALAPPALAGEAPSSPSGLSYMLPPSTPLSPFSSTPWLSRSPTVTSSTDGPSLGPVIDDPTQLDRQPSTSAALQPPQLLPVPGIHPGSFKGIRMEHYDSDSNPPVPESSTSVHAAARSPPSPALPLRSPTSLTSPRPMYTSPSSTAHSLPSPRDSAAVSRRKTVGASIVAAASNHAKGEGGQLMRGLGIMDHTESDGDEDHDQQAYGQPPSVSGEETPDRSNGTAARREGGPSSPELRSSRSPPPRRSTHESSGSEKLATSPVTSTMGRKKSRPDLSSSGPSPTGPPPPLPTSSSSSRYPALPPSSNSQHRPTTPSSSSGAVPPLPIPPQFPRSDSGVLDPRSDGTVLDPPSPAAQRTLSSPRSKPSNLRSASPSSYRSHPDENVGKDDAEPVNRAGLGSRHLFSPTHPNFPSLSSQPPVNSEADTVGKLSPSSRPGTGEKRLSTSSQRSQPGPLSGRPLSTGSRGSSRALPQPPPPKQSHAANPSAGRAPPAPPPVPTGPQSSTPTQQQQFAHQQQQQQSQRMAIPDRRGDPLAAYIPGLANELGPYPSPRRSMNPWATGVDGIPQGSRQPALGNGLPGGPKPGPGQMQRLSMPGQRQEEVCLECLTRDRDLITVDVSSPGIWARQTDADFDDLAEREHAGEDVTDLLKGGRKWEGGGPVGMGMVAGYEGSKRRTLRGHRLTEEALRDWTQKNPPASTHRFQTLQVYLLSQSQLLNAEATSRASTSIESRILSNKMRDTFDTLRRETGAPIDPSSGGVRVRPPRPVEGAKETVMLESGIIIDKVDLKKAEKERRKSNASGAGLGSSWGAPGGGEPGQQQRSSTTPAHLPSQRISSGSTVFLPSPSYPHPQPHTGDLSQLRPTASYSAFQDQQQLSGPPMTGQVVRPFSFAVWAGAGRGRSASTGAGGGDGHSLKDGRTGGSFLGRFRGSERGWGGSQASDATGGGRSFWGGSGSMMDMHLGLDRDKEQRDMARFSKPYQAAASTDALNRPWMQSDQYSLRGSSTHQFEPQSESMPSSPVRGEASGVGNLPGKKKKKGLMALFSKLGGGSTKSNSSFGNSPQINQQPFEEDLSSPLPPPPSLSYLSRNGASSNGGGPNSRDSGPSHSRSSSANSSQSAQNPNNPNSPLYPPNLSAGGPSYPNQQGRSVSSPVGMQASLPQHGKTPSLSPSTASASSPSPSSIRFPARRGSRDTMGSRKSGLIIDSNDPSPGGMHYGYGQGGLRGSLASSPGEIATDKRKSLGDGLNGLSEMGVVNGGYDDTYGRPLSSTMPSRPNGQHSVGQKAGVAYPTYGGHGPHHPQSQASYPPNGINPPSAMHPSMGGRPHTASSIDHPSSMSSAHPTSAPSGPPVHQQAPSPSRRLSLYKDLPPLPPPTDTPDPSSNMSSPTMTTPVQAGPGPAPFSNHPSPYAGQSLSRPQSHQILSPRQGGPHANGHVSPRPNTAYQSTGVVAGVDNFADQHQQRGWDGSHRGGTGTGGGAAKKEKKRGKLSGFFGVGKKDKMGEGHLANSASDHKEISRAITRDESDFAAYRYPSNDAAFEPQRR